MSPLLINVICFLVALAGGTLCVAVLIAWAFLFKWADKK